MKNQVKKLLNVSEVEITYKTKINKKDRKKITSSEDAYNLLKQVYNNDTVEYVESFYILILNRANEAIGVKQISQGVVAGTVVDPKVIFQTALKANASAIILSHNHPSGNLTPSSADINFTKKLMGGGKLLDISIHDHIIYTSDGYLSMADEGII